MYVGGSVETVVGNTEEELCTCFITEEVHLLVGIGADLADLSTRGVGAEEGVARPIVPGVCNVKLAVGARTTGMWEKEYVDSFRRRSIILSERCREKEGTEGEHVVGFVHG